MSDDIHDERNDITEEEEPNIEEEILEEVDNVPREDEDIETEK